MPMLCCRRFLRKAFRTRHSMKHGLVANGLWRCAAHRFALWLNRSIYR